MLILIVKLAFVNYLINLRKSGTYIFLRIISFKVKKFFQYKLN